MANDQTIAEAEGNAAAIVNVIESAPPETCPFDKGPLTRGMEALHMVNNVDILELAEEIAQAENDIATANIPKTRSELEVGRSFNPEGKVAAAQEKIRRLEEEILDELDEAQNEYRTLAHALCAERKEYVEARKRVGLDKNLPRAGELARMRSRREGIGPSYRPELTSEDLDTVHSFEETLAAFHALESGYHYMTTKEQWGVFFNFLAVELATEVVTFGLGKYVKAVRVLDEAVGAMIARAGKAVVSRFDRLPDPVKTRLNRVFERRHGETRVDFPNNGVGDEAADAGRLTRGCVSGACR